MEELTLYSKYFMKVAIVLKTLFSKPLDVVISMPIVVTAPLYTTAEMACGILASFFVIDFITGIVASWVEFKRVPALIPTSDKRYLIQSAKLRMSGVKFICYVLAILCAWMFETVFMIKEIPTGHISTQNLTLTTIVIAFFCLIEFYSIFFENIKRAGFDIIEMIKKISHSGWGVYKSIKNGKNATD